MLIELVLRRIESSDQGTFGRLSGLGFDFFTGELPWKDNQPNISCIPGGVYRGEWSYSERFKRAMYHITPVDGRAGIRVHSANLMGATPKYKAQLNGCIALSDKLGWIDGQKALLVSRPAIRRFETTLNGKPFGLTITNAFN